MPAPSESTDHCDQQEGWPSWEPSLTLSRSRAPPTTHSGQHLPDAWPQYHPVPLPVSPAESEEGLEPRRWRAVKKSSYVSLLSLCGHHVKSHFLFQKEGIEPPSLAHSRVLAKHSVIHWNQRHGGETGLQMHSAGKRRQLHFFWFGFHLGYDGPHEKKFAMSMQSFLRHTVQ